MSAFVDTSAIYALLVRSEEGHPATVAAFRSLVESGQGLFTTSYVLVEAVALLQHRLGLDPIRDLEEAIVPLLAVEWVATPLHRKGVERLLRQDRHRLSLVDCVSLEFMRSAGIRQALALDPHLGQDGAAVLPRRQAP